MIFFSAKPYNPLKNFVSDTVFSRVAQKVRKNETKMLQYCTSKGLGLIRFCTLFVLNKALYTAAAKHDENDMYSTQTLVVVDFSLFGNVEKKASIFFLILKSYKRR